MLFLCLVRCHNTISSFSHASQFADRVFAVRWPSAFRLVGLVPLLYSVFAITFANFIQFHAAYWIARIGVAIRFAEAQNPGPCQTEDVKIRFCITNPTSLALKSDTYHELMKTHVCDVVTCSETSATESTQRHFAKEMKKHGKKVIWSPAVSPLRTTVTGQLDGRGQASGVAAITSMPIRHARLKTPDEWCTSTRFIHTILKLGEAHVQMMVIYCRPAGSQQATLFNQSLMDMALGQARLVPLPLLILGDFNANPADMSCWPQLQAEGFQHLAGLYDRMYSCPMPPSCKGVTNPDTAILCPVLARMVCDIQVLSSEWFATHAPVVFRIRVPQGRIFRNRMRFPRSFAELGLHQSEIDQAAETICNNADPQTLEDWGSLVEKVFDKAVADSHPTLESLPRSFRGRCKMGGVVKCPIHSPVRKASDGDFEPTTEVLTMKTQRMIKQLRRLDSLFHRLTKLEKQGPHTALTMVELKQEWQAIQKCTAFGMPFLFWTQGCHELALPAWPLPTAAWINDVRQHVKLETEHRLYMDAKLLRDKNKYFRELDKQNHNKHAYACVRGPGNPPITEMGANVSFEALAVPTEQPGVFELYADSAEIQALTFDSRVVLADQGAKIVSIHAHFAVVEMHDLKNTLEEQVVVKQNQFVIEPEKIVERLNDFWMPLWQRDLHDLSFLEHEETQDFRTILDVVPALPHFEVDMLDSELWMRAIRRLKAHSARGCEKISAQELKMLPLKLVQLLAQVMGKYERGFPADFMIGMTAPLAKTMEIPKNSQTRPISILPQLYRLWAMVACRQIAQHMSKYITKDVTGLLSQRGSADMAYGFQFHLEKSKSRHSSLSGVTLDLIKCFNNVKWRFGYMMLRHLGLPKALMVQWMASIGHMTRVWLLQGEVFSAGVPSTGFPEGDCWSVLIMIGIANAWCHYMRSSCVREGMILSAYADNWAWIMSQPQDHSVALNATVSLASTAGLALDFDKTWFWCTHVEEVDTVKQQLALVPNGEKIKQKTSASDLWHQMQYSGNAQKGITSERMEKGIRRLQRLKHMPQDIDVKEILLRTSILPAAFYGCTIRPPASDAIEHFRSLAARALLGDGHSLNPAIALLCTQGGILDPEVWIILQVIRSARNFLLKSDAQAREDFLWMASRFRGALHNVKGPASCLAFCLRKLDWQIDKHGGVHVTAFLNFNLLHCSFQRFARFVTQAWQEQHVMMHSQRTKWFNMPDICRRDTVATLAHFSAKQRVALLRELAGGFQLSSQKAKWLPEVDDKCAYCEAIDSREHRLLQCPVGQHVREQYQPTIHNLEEHGSLIAQFPFATVHPGFEAMQLIAFNAPQPIWGDAISEHVHDMIARNVDLHWFTDGSCFNPSSPLTRYSAFAVVLDLCETNMERKHFACCYNSVEQLTCFQTAITARTSGEQDILRAEMQAIAAIMMQFGEGAIHTDSQGALDLMMVALHATTPLEFAACEHMDILYRVWSQRSSIHNNLFKVKAHVAPQHVDDDLQRYWTLGNAVVNDLAKFACEHLQPAFVSAMNEMHRDAQNNMAMLSDVFSLHLELQATRAIADKEHKGDAAKVQHTHEILMMAFSDWKVEPCRIISSVHDTRFLEHSSFGEHLARATLEWIRCLKWPMEGDTSKGPMGYSTGISWIEMAMSWMFFHTEYVPILRKDDRGVKRLIQPSCPSDAQDASLTLAETGTMVQKMIDNLEALLPETLLFPCKRGKVSSLYHQGSKVFVQGLKMRPQLPNQCQVAKELQRLFNTAPKPLQATPTIPAEMDTRVVFQGSWIFRQDRAKLKMKLVRKIRAEN